jgi:hypothetical protein
VCLIVDASIASLVFGDQPSPRFGPVLRWLYQEEGRLVYGGHLANELRKVGAAARSIAELRKAGKALLYDDARLADDERAVQKTGHLRSNDGHVIALARVSGARVLCSDDQNLIRDFTDRNLISKPRGSVYMQEEHIALLEHCRGCPGPLPASRRKRSARPRRCP